MNARLSRTTTQNVASKPSNARPARKVLVRAATVDAPAKISATDRVQLGQSDLQVSGEQQLYGHLRW